MLAIDCLPYIYNINVRGIKQQSLWIGAIKLRNLENGAKRISAENTARSELHTNVGKINNIDIISKFKII